MIQNIRNKKPKISFGLGNTVKTISLSESVKVYQSEVFNSNIDLQIIEPSGLIARKSNNNEFEIIPTAVGNYKINIKNGISTSNTITLIVE